MDKYEELMEKGFIRKIKRGYYEWQDGEFVSDATIITRLFLDAVIYLLSALYIYGYIDRTPNEWHLAVERGSSRSRFDIFILYVVRKNLKVGQFSSVNEPT